MRNAKKVIVGLSGGVDSAVSLFLLKKQGFDTIGVFLKMGSWQGRSKNSEQKQINTVKKICSQMNTPCYVLDCFSEFKKKVIDYFKNSLKKGLTPNPCVICNYDLKFKKLIQFAKIKKADYVATGHYARIKRVGDKYELLRAKDKKKDQSYFLCLLTQNQLRKIIFPLGNLRKREVLQIARKNKWQFLSLFYPSQDLCFLGPQKIVSYLKRMFGLKKGNIKDIQGNILGTHQGLYFYTLGQRKRIGLSGGPWWVVGFDYRNNDLIISKDKNDPRLFAKEVMVSNFHFISGEKFPAKRSFIKIRTKLRYQAPLVWARLYPLGNRLKLVFQKKQRTPTPGQFAVFYKNDICLGGGIIDKL